MLHFELPSVLFCTFPTWLPFSICVSSDGFSLRSSDPRSILPVYFISRMECHSHCQWRISYLVNEILGPFLGIFTSELLSTSFVFLSMPNFGLFLVFPCMLSSPLIFSASFSLACIFCYCPFPLQFPSLHFHFRRSSACSPLFCNIQCSAFFSVRAVAKERMKWEEFLNMDCQNDYFHVSALSIKPSKQALHSAEFIVY